MIQIPVYRKIQYNLLASVGKSMLFLCPFGGEILRKLNNYKPTKFKAKNSYYDKEYADFAVAYKNSMEMCENEK